jgi:hypothetical protein
VEFELREEFFRDADLGEQRNHHTRSHRIGWPLEPVLSALWSTFGDLRVAKRALSSYFVALSGRKTAYTFPESALEDKMANRVGWTFGASFLVLSLIIGPAAFAAADNVGQESPSQAGQDSKSYLPPWMQGQGSSEKASAPANTAAPATTATTPTPESKSTAASNDDAMKRKVRAGQGRRSHRHGSPADFMSGFVGFFGR